jgi:Peptidase M50B-like
MSSRRSLVFAVATAWLLEHVVPFGRLVLYPFTLLATWVHETGHGLAGLATGGRFHELVIYWDASGYAGAGDGVGWHQAVVSLGGLWAPPLVGAMLLAVARGPRRARIALTVMAALMLLTLALWVRSPAGYVAVPLTAALIGWVAWRARPERRVLFAQFIAVMLALDTIGRMIGYALSTTATVGGKDQKSDVVMLADAAGGHYLLWGLVVIVGAMAMLAAGSWVAWRKPRTPASPDRPRASRR